MPAVRLAMWLTCAGLVAAGCGSAATGVPQPGPVGGELTSTLTPPPGAGDLPALIAAADLPPCPAPVAASAAPAVEGGLPDLTLACLGEGESVRLSGLRGPLLINVWASWCGPCQAEAPVLAAFTDAHGDQVPLLGIDIGDTRTGGLAAAARWGTSFSSVQDPAEEIKAALRPPYLGPPATYLLRADGTVAPLILGEITDTEQIVTALSGQGIELSGP